MKIKYRLRTVLLPVNILWLYTTISLFIGLYDILSFPIKTYFFLFIFLEFLFVLYIFFGIRIVLEDHAVISKFYFLRKRMEINESTRVLIKRAIGISRKRLVITTGKKKLVFWDFYSVPLELVSEEVKKRSGT